MEQGTVAHSSITMPQPTRYFITVEWCNDGHHGIFCRRSGACFWKDCGPHTDHEMYAILGPFFLILSPKSEALTEAEVSRLTRFRPLAEYCNEYGIALKERDVTTKEV